MRGCREASSNTRVNSASLIAVWRRDALTPHMCVCVPQQYAVGVLTGG